MIRDAAARRGVALTAMSDYYLDPSEDSSLLVLGYARSPEPLIRAGVRELAATVRAVRASSSAVLAVTSV
jgi:DNA-binding transcriptional MocR family regulator